MADEKKSASPLRAFLDIRGPEWPLALSMCGSFFLIITTFWILKPIKKVVFLNYYRELDGLDLWGMHLDPAQTELIAKIANLAVAFVAAIVFTALARKLRRERLVIAFCAFFVLALVFFSFAIGWRNDAIVWSFYLFGDLFSTLMVAAFFAFLNDSVSPQAAKRLYGLVVFGGVAGGAVGTTLLAAWIGNIERYQWLWICLGFVVLIAVLAWVAGRLVSKDVVDAPASKTADAPKQKSESNAAIAGARLVLTSPYLLAIVAIVGLYEIVSTIMDFQFSSTVLHYNPTEEASDQHFANIYAITAIASLVVQLFVTTTVMNRFPLTVALLITPIVILSASAAFVALPILWVGSMLNTADNAFNYSINQSAREALYTPTTREEKYAAKAFIDMFVQRFAKVIAVFVSLGVTMAFTDFFSKRWLSLVTVAVGVAWLGAAYYAGRRFREMTREDGDQPAASTKSKS
jgi:ATP:ADP antiporter, AAA family